MGSIVLHSREDTVVLIVFCETHISAILNLNMKCVSKM